MDGPRRAIRLEAARHGLKAIAKLAALLDKKGVADATVISAAIHLLDRGYGKPAQEVRYSGVVGNYNLEGLSDEELDQFIALARKASADAIGESGLTEFPTNIAVAPLHALLAEKAARAPSPRWPLRPIKLGAPSV